MAAIEYRMFFDGTPATQDQLDRLEDVTVEQEVDMMWEARVQIPICVNGDGRWEGEQEAWMREFTRVRIEARIGENDFTPLIDGPIVGYDTERSSVPGRSMVTLVVRDDSVFLNREEEVSHFEGMTDSQIARQIYGQVPQLAAAPPDIPEETPAQPGSLTPATMQRGTRMQLLRSLAARHGDWHAYVLPGPLPGQSIGAFRRFPTEPDGLPPMVLIGDSRNIRDFNVRNNQTRPADVRRSTMSVTDKGITTATSSFRDRTLMGDEPAAGASGNTAQRLTPPGAGDTVDPDSATRGAAALSGYATEATGSVIPHCYHGVLRPYRVVQVQISDSAFSANYLITKVTHKLTRSTYTQEFTAKGDSVSTAAAGSPTGPQPSAGASASFNIQGSIF